MWHADKTQWPLQPYARDSGTASEKLLTSVRGFARPTQSFLTRFPIPPFRIKGALIFALFTLETKTLRWQNRSWRTMKTLAIPGPTRIRARPVRCGENALAARELALAALEDGRLPRAVRVRILGPAAPTCILADGVRLRVLPVLRHLLRLRRALL